MSQEQNANLISAIRDQMFNLDDQRYYQQNCPILAQEYLNHCHALSALGEALIEDELAAACDSQDVLKLEAAGFYRGDFDHLTPDARMRAAWAIVGFTPEA